MGKIIMSENVSLDGVVEDPAGDEGFRVGGWVGRIADRPAVAKVTLDEALATEAMLLGRRSYEWLAARWPSRTGALADRLNSVPKYVVSSTLEDPKWNNSAVLKGDVVTEAAVVSQGIYAGQPSDELDAAWEKACREPTGWRLLLQVDSDDEMEMMWGDCGMLYYCIRDEDLRARRFDDVWLVSQCY